jgi:hypothetical protein
VNRRIPTILAACNDEKLFAPWFKGKKRKSFANWFTLLSALFALPMTPEQLEVFKQCTGRNAPPASPVNEVWLQIGRRGGKSFILALIAVYLSCFREYRHLLAPGERGTVVIIAQDRKAARAIFRFVKGLLHGVPMLKRMIERETAEVFDLNNRISIEIHVASFRSSRGYTIVAALCDEIAFWRSEESANPDRDILRSLRPGLATTNGMLLCASSPYAQRGEMWNAFRRHYGKDNDVLYWRAPTRFMNPSIPQRVIDKEYEEDATSAMAEYGAEFRSDEVNDFISRAVVDGATIEGRYELLYVAGRYYLAFVDASGGSRDSMTLAIAHTEGNKVILDLVREVKAPLSPNLVAEKFSAIIKAYGLTSCFGDNYGAALTREMFTAHGVDYTKATINKSEIYLNFLPLINSKRVEWLDNPRLSDQLCGLQRFIARGGHETVDHLPGHNYHDDLCNAACGAIVYAAKRVANQPSILPPVVSGYADPYTSVVLRPDPEQQVGADLRVERERLAKLCRADEMVPKLYGVSLEKYNEHKAEIERLDAELAKLPSFPQPEAAPQLNATQLYYLNGCPDMFYAIGGRTKREVF